MADGGASQSSLSLPEQIVFLNNKVAHLKLILANTLDRLQAEQAARYFIHEELVAANADLDTMRECVTQAESQVTSVSAANRALQMSISLAEEVHQEELCRVVESLRINKDSKHRRTKNSPHPRHSSGKQGSIDKGTQTILSPSLVDAGSDVALTMEGKLLFITPRPPTCTYDGFSHRNTLAIAGFKSTWRDTEEGDTEAESIPGLKNYLHLLTPRDYVHS
jgi:hypothetical protein